MASRRVRIDAQTGDIVRTAADVIAVKYQGHLSGATQHVARALSVSAADLQAAMPAEGMVHVVPGGGRIAARHAIFLRVAPASSFKYPHVREFNAAILRALRTCAPDTRHLAVTMHGVGFDTDLEDSLSAIVRGCGDAIRAGEMPDALEAVTIVDRRFDDSAAIRRLLDDLAPGGAIDAPGPPPAAAPPPRSSPPAPAADPGGTPSLFDIFISFKSEDERYARQVYETLTGNGLRVFFSRASLPHLGSEAYHAQIDKAIEHARHMVVVTTSAEHVNSRWVEYEWRLFMGEQLAGRKAGNLIPVIAGDMPIWKLPICMRPLQVLRCDGEGLASLVEYTRMDVDRIGVEPVQPARPPAAPRSGEVAGVSAGPDLIVAVQHVLWNTSWTDALEHLVTSRETDPSNGWRLPTLDELAVIRRHRLLPADSCYWSGQQVAGGEACYVHFDDGHAGQGPKSFSNGVAAVFVRTPAAKGPPRDR